VRPGAAEVNASETLAPSVPIRDERRKTSPGLAAAGTTAALERLRRNGYLRPPAGTDAARRSRFPSRMRV
jgi:hypothetical protein